jgi:xylulose-5-phosphate/fructose-6-phosphate phosphoketolase
MTVADRPTLTIGDQRLLDAYWRAANYLSVGQIYLLTNPLLTQPLRPGHIKPRLLGHWGTTPGLNFIWAHLNRAIVAHDLNMMLVIGPGHGGPAALANCWLEGTYSEVYPSVPQDAVGMANLFRQFSFPGGVPSHVAPETPGSIHEGGELGYSLSHAHGAAFDNPDLIVACVVGDGEAETGPLATSWHSGKFLDPARDGAVLPILHLNGWKIANPAVLARIPEAELDALLRGYGYAPVYVTGHEPEAMHERMAAVVDQAVADIRSIQEQARAGAEGRGLPRWPLIVLRTPKGWTGPAEVDGVPVEGTWRSHQVPLGEVRTNPGHLRQLEEWMRSYRPGELFDGDGRPRQELRGLPPRGRRRMSANPHANGGLLLRDLTLPDFRAYAVPAAGPGEHISEPTRVLGDLIRDTFLLNAAQRNFRIFGPDETASNRLDAAYEATGKTWEEALLPVDQHLARDGRVMEILSEHTCQGWLEGYLLTGRHGLFSCYEAFIHIVDSMFNQHAKWLKTTRTLPWRRPIASLNYLLTSHVWRQDNNGFSHQDPGFIDHVINKKAEVVRVYLPPDTNTLLSVADHCLRSRNYVNVIVAGKNPAPDWLDMESAVLHCTRGAGIWEWASTDGGATDPDVVLACAGDVPTLEVLAAADILRRHLPQLRVRVVNVVDLMRLEPETEHPHGMSDPEFDALFTTDRPVIFAYHGYPWLIHRLTYRRNGHANIHVRGYKEEGTTTTPFDMVVMNDMDRFHLVMDVIDRVPGLGQRAARLRQLMADTRIRHHAWTRAHGEDLPEVRDWVWAHESPITRAVGPDGVAGGADGTGADGTGADGTGADGTGADEAATANGSVRDAR